MLPTTDAAATSATSTAVFAPHPAFSRRRRVRERRSIFSTRQASQPKRIAVISNTAWSLTNFRTELIEGLRTEGHRVLTVAPNDDHQLQHRLELMSDGFVPLQHLNRKGKNPYQDWKFSRELRSILMQHKIDVALTFTPKPNIYTSLAAKGLKTEVIPTINGLGNVFTRPSLTQSIMLRLYRHAMRNCRRVVFQNRDDRNFFIEQSIVQSRQCLLSPGSGVSLEHFPAIAEAPDDSSEEIRFLFSARLVREKGIVEFLEAAEAIRQAGLPASFWVLGLPADNPSCVDDQLLRDYEKRGVIHYLGHTDDMNSALEKTDILVLPSYYREGVPRVLLEGLSKGLPIITTDSIGCRETVIHGKNGLLVQPRCVNSLVAAMTHMIHFSPQRRREMGRHSRFLAEQKFDVHEVVEIYQRILDASAPTSIVEHQPAWVAAV